MGTKSDDFVIWRGELESFEMIRVSIYMVLDGPSVQELMSKTELSYVWIELK